MKVKYSLTAVAFLFSVQLFAQDWAWIGGTQANNDPGNYGTQGITSPTNTPPGREDMAVEKVNDSLFYLFGGLKGSDFFNDLWRYNSITNEWTWLAGSQNFGEPGIYGVQGVPDPANMPGSRRRMATAVDDNGNLWVFGGDGYDVNGDIGRLNDLWKYNPVSGEWTWMSGSTTRNAIGDYGTIDISVPSNQPPARYWAEMWYTNDRVYLFGGITTGNKNDVWYFDTATDEWVWTNGTSGSNTAGVYGNLNVPAPSNQIGTRNSFDLIKTSNGDSIYVFGGFGNDVNGNPGVMNDMWLYVSSTNQWTWVNGSDERNAISNYGSTGIFGASNTPGARRYVSTANRGDSLFYLYGGFGKQATTTNTDLSELWAFDPSNNQWAFLEGSTFGPNAINYGTLDIPGPNVNPGARDYSEMFFGAPKNLLIFGGRNEGNTAKNDLFVKDYCELDFDQLNFSPITCYAEADGIMEITTINNIGPVSYSTDGMSYQSSNLFTQLDTGNYTFYIEDEFGCKNSTNYTVTQPDTLIAEAVITDDIDCFGGTGVVEVQVTGGTPQYNYSEDNVSYTTGSGSGFNTYNPEAGNFTYYVTDFNSCLDSTEVTITQPDSLELEFEIIDSMLCNGDLASVNLTAVGGTGAYGFSNDGNNYASNTFFDNLPQGNFDFYVQDVNGCITENSISFTNPSQIVIAGLVNDEQQGDDGSINISVSGGTTPYQYSWSNGEQTEDVSGLDGGVYTITITDENGCTHAETFTVESFVSLEDYGKNEVQLYPNPNSGQMTIKFTDHSSGRVLVRDLTGRIVFDLNTNTNEYQFNHNLSSGKYIMQVVREGSEDQFYRFIVK